MRTLLFAWLTGLVIAGVTAMVMIMLGKANRPGPGLFIGLLGDENGRTEELDWTVKQLLRCAQRTDRDFIWHWMGQGVMNSNDWLADSAEALLACKRPSHEMTFWQEAVIGGI